MSFNVDWATLDYPYYVPGEVLNLSGDPSCVLCGVVLANVRAVNWFLPLPKLLKKVNGVSVRLTAVQSGYYFKTIGNIFGRPQVNVDYGDHNTISENGIMFQTNTTTDTENLPTYTQVLGSFRDIRITFS